MVESQPFHNTKEKRKKGKFPSDKRSLNQYKKLVSMGKISVDIIKELYNPIDATNRFINLALQNVEEDSQNRQFLLESKSGIRKMAMLVNKLSDYAKKLEEEAKIILESNG